MLVMFAITMGLLLSFSALVIDVGQGYLWKQRLDRAARAAALAGLGFRGLTGWEHCKSTTGFDELKAIVQSVAKENLSSYGNLPSPPNVTPIYTGTDDKLTVTVSLTTKSFLAGRLNNVLGFSLGNSTSGGTTTISGTHAAQLNPAYIALLLDVSGSMGCPSGSTNVSCACRLTGSCTGRLRTDDLAVSAEKFRTFFNPNRDVVAVIPFNLAAHVTFPMKNGSTVQAFGTARNGTTLDAQIAAAKLKDLTKSNTNICDALIRAIDQFEALAADSSFAGREKVTISPTVVLFSDGAPNAFRGIFTDTDTTKFPANRDAYQYSLEWYDGAKTYRGPGPVVPRTVDLDGKPHLFGHPIGAGSVAPVASGSCGPVVSDPRYFQSVLDTTATPQTGQTSGCLKKLDFKLPIPSATTEVKISGVPFSDTASSYIDSNWTGIIPPVTGPIAYQNFDQLPYYCSIAAADYIRSTFGGTIFTIGLGPAAPVCNDPMQDADDHLNRKDIFLARLSMAQESLAVTTTQGVGVNEKNAWNTPYDFYSASGVRRSISTKSNGNCTDNNASTNPDHRFQPAAAPDLKVGYTSSQPHDPETLKPYNPSFPNNEERKYDTRGEYVRTTNSVQLPALFATIAKQILLRLAPST
jgi:Flp pilus assembly protein TadG